MALRIVHGLVLLVLVAMLGSSDPAWAGPPTEQLRAQMDRVIKVLEDPELADLAIEGVSMVANDRAQFNKIIQASGYPALVSKLTEKQEQGLEADREPAIRKASQTK